MGLHNYLPVKLKKAIKLYFTGPQLNFEIYSYDGQDIILLNLFQEYGLMKSKGFFVDIGAYHPYTTSNTYLFYLRGWRGINIDPRPGSMDLFRKYRNEDINLELGISKEPSMLEYYFIDDNSTMNTFSREYLESINMLGDVKKVIPIKTLPLSQVLDEYGVPESGIDYLNIDVEGMDLEVLQSNDFVKYRPKVICVEVGDIFSIEDIFDTPIYKYLASLDYTCVAKNFILRSVSTLFFLDKQFINK